MILYQVSGETVVTFGTKAQAMKQARTEAPGTTVERLIVSTDRATILNLINGRGGYVMDAQVIYTVPESKP